MGLFSRAFGSRSKKVPYPPALQPQIEKAMNNLSALTAAHDGAWQIGAADWSVDQYEGTIVFDSPQGIRAVAPAQIIGTYDTRQGTWLWSWDNSSISAPLTEHARRIQAFGLEQGFDLLTTRKLTCPEEQGWELTALACLLCGAQGAYRGPADSTLIFFTFGEVALSKTPGV
jgi:uncharacterized protein DUF6882